MQYTLNGAWQLGFTMPETGEWKQMPTTVPGNVEIALEEQGILTDIMPADNPAATELFDQVDDWTYTRSFDAPSAEDGWTQELVFEGIDTIGDIYLNGEKIYCAQDMFMAHRINVAGKLKARDNELKVVIRSALLWARQHHYDIFNTYSERTSHGGQSYLRKARHEWGWDNAPRLLTSGIYRGVYLEYLPPTRFENVYCYTGKICDDHAELGIIWDYRTTDGSLSKYQLRCTLRSEGNIAYQKAYPLYFTHGSVRFSVPLDKIKLWWPTGFGEPYLCDVTLEMLCGEDVVCAWNGKWGIRTLRLERTEDIQPDGSGEFVFVVNNQKIYVNGTNWKPLDALHSRADAKVIPALELANDLHCNMIRIWGGGIYEDHTFFDYCDAHGIMVWQDFMFGCEFPPLDDWYCEVVAEETRYIIEKLRNHPSLAVWCGDNEDDECLTWAHGNSTILPSDNKITRKVLRECVLRYDPYRSYVESSPYASDDNIRDRRSGSMTHFQPESHLYPATLHFAEALRNNMGKFIGETGPIAVNAMTENPNVWAVEEKRAARLWDLPIADEDRTNGYHQWDAYFQSWRQTGKILCESWYQRDFSAAQWRDYADAINIICGDVFKDVIEYCRTNRWRKTGVIWWSLVDMWKMGFNYSVVDYDYHKKMPYYWIRQSQQPFALMVVRQEIGGEIALYAANDTLTRHIGEYTITSVGENGGQRVIASGEYDEAPNSSRMLQRLPEHGKQELWLISWVEDGQKHYNHFVTGHRPYDFAAWQNWLKQLNALYGAEE